MKVTVTIPKARTVSDTEAHTRTYYEISVESAGQQWSIDRTFLEFSGLDRNLRIQCEKMMKKIHFPNEPLQNRFSKQEINARKDRLSNYLQEIANSKKLREIPVFCRFLNLYAHLDIVEDKVESEEEQQLAEVLHFFLGRTELELSVERGDVVIFIEKDGDWSYCQYRGEIGYIPTNYIELIDHLPQEKDEEIDLEEIEKEKATAPPLPPPKIPAPPTEKEKEERRDNLLDELALRGSGLELCKDTKKLRKADDGEAVKEDHKDVVAVALFDFTGTQENELSFKKGDQIIVYSKETAWWQGGRDGVIGYFPSDYVALLDGETPIEVIASAGTQREVNSKALHKEFKQIEEQIKKRILEQHNLMEEAKRKLSWAKPGTKSYQDAFNMLEEHRTLHDSLLQNLKNHQQAGKKSIETVKEKSIVDQVKDKIKEHKDEMVKIQNLLKNCAPEERKGFQNQLEERQMLLSALYENLESLAMYRLQEEEIQKKQEEIEMITILRKRVAAQVLKVEECRSALVNCSGSYEESVRVNQELEENLLLLQALQANLEALTGNTEQPNINAEPTQKQTNRASMLLTKGITSFRKSKRAPKSPQRQKEAGLYTVHHSRPASSFYLPELGGRKSEIKKSSQMLSNSADVVNSRLPVPSTYRQSESGFAIPTKPAPKPPGKTIPEDIAPAGPGERPTRADGKPVIILNPKPRKQEKKVAHSTFKVDQVTGGEKKKRAVRVACAADNEKSVMGSKKKYYCILCVCENFEPSPPPKPENCRNCKHEFSTHRLHRIRSVRMDKSLFQTCIKAQLSFFI